MYKENRRTAAAPNREPSAVYGPSGPRAEWRANSEPPRAAENCAGGIHFRRAFQIKGWSRPLACGTHKEGHHPGHVLLFGTSQQYRCRTICERIIFLSTSWCAVSTSLCKFLTSGHFLLWSLRHLEIRRHRKRQFYFADHICVLPLAY